MSLHHTYVYQSYTFEECDASGMTEYALRGGRFYLLPFHIARDLTALGKGRPSTEAEAKAYPAHNPVKHYTRDAITLREVPTNPATYEAKGESL